MTNGRSLINPLEIDSSDDYTHLVAVAAGLIDSYGYVAGTRIWSNEIPNFDSISITRINEERIRSDKRLSAVSDSAYCRAGISRGIK